MATEGFMLITAVTLAVLAQSPTIDTLLPVRIGTPWPEALKELRSKGTKCDEKASFARTDAWCSYTVDRETGKDQRVRIQSIDGGKTVTQIEWSAEVKPARCEAIVQRVVKLFADPWKLEQIASSRGAKAAGGLKGEAAVQVQCNSMVWFKLTVDDAWTQLQTGQNGMGMQLLGRLAENVVINSMSAADVLNGDATTPNAVRLSVQHIKDGYEHARSSSEAASLSARSKAALEAFAQIATTQDWFQSTMKVALASRQTRGDR